MLVYLVVAHVLQLISPLWATHIGDDAESGALQEYMRHRTVQAAQHTYETRLGLHMLFVRIVAASVGERLLSQPDLTPGWLHGSSPKFLRALEVQSCNSRACRPRNICSGRERYLVPILRLDSGMSCLTFCFQIQDACFQDSRLAFEADHKP
jgi:hypothetical protein